MISMDMLHDAQQVLAPVISRTPMVSTKGIVPGCDFCLKADCLQKTGAFKLRGAYYKIATLSDEEKARGVIACSAGNHAQGVAYAARDMGIRATICIPEGAPISKIEATRSYGANVVLVPGVYDDAYAEAVRLRDEQGLTFIHPFNDYRIMAGQGTLGLEILEQLPDVDAIFVPIGGGGLIGGLAYAVKHLKPACRVIGVQAAGAPSMAESLKKGEIITLSSVDTIADGIKVKTPGDLTSRRGQIQGQEARPGAQQVDALVPLANMFGYATDLRSNTQGRGQYTMEPHSYAEIPKSIRDKIVEERGKKAD